MQEGIWEFFKFEITVQNNVFYLVCVFFNFERMVNINVLENKMTL